MWQDFVFLAGSMLSLFFLVPTLRDSMARVPLGTTAPSAAIGFIYGATFLSLGMTFSGFGAIATGLMWTAIASLRSPKPVSPPWSTPDGEARSTRARAPHAD